MKNNFSLIPFLKYSNSSVDAINIRKIKNELNNWYNNCNDYLYNSINYEKLIYLENKYQNNLEIYDLIEKLKNKIAQNYENKQRLISKLSLNRELLDEQ